MFEAPGPYPHQTQVLLITWGPGGRGGERRGAGLSACWADVHGGAPPELRGQTITVLSQNIWNVVDDGDTGHCGPSVAPGWDGARMRSGPGSAGRSPLPAVGDLVGSSPPGQWTAAGGGATSASPPGFSAAPQGGGPPAQWRGRPYGVQEAGPCWPAGREDRQGATAASVTPGARRCLLSAPDPGLAFVRASGFVGGSGRVTQEEPGPGVRTHVLGLPPSTRLFCSVRTRSPGAGSAPTSGHRRGSGSRSQAGTGRRNPVVKVVVRAVLRTRVFRTCFRCVCVSVCVGVLL